jgi:hypothetical protein
MPKTNKMTKKQFTEKFAELPNLKPIFVTSAKECLKGDVYDDEDSLVQYLIDQYGNRGSRKQIESMLSEELLAELKLFVCDDILGEDHAMQIRLVSKTTKIAELKKIILDQKVVITSLSDQLGRINKQR